MKKSILAVALSTILFAGANNNIATSNVKEIKSDNFYIGFGYGYVKADLTKTVAPGNDPVRDSKHNSIMFQAGYKFNEFLSLEARYYKGFDDDFYRASRDHTKTFNALGIYLKPTYSYKNITLYALAGYAKLYSDFTVHNPAGDITTNLDDHDFSWGIGLSYKLTQDISIFGDYIKVYNKTQTHIRNNIEKKFDINDKVFTVGLTYHF